VSAAGRRRPADQGLPPLAAAGRGVLGVAAVAAAAAGRDAGVASLRRLPRGRSVRRLGR